MNYLGLLGSLERFGRARCGRIFDALCRLVLTKPRLHVKVRP